MSLSDLELELVESLVESLVEEQEQDLELVELVELVELAAAVVAFVALVPLVEPFAVASTPWWIKRVVENDGDSARVFGCFDV